MDMRRRALLSSIGLVAGGMVAEDGLFRSADTASVHRHKRTRTRPLKSLLELEDQFAFAGLVATDSGAYEVAGRYNHGDQYYRIASTESTAELYLLEDTTYTVVDDELLALPDVPQTSSTGPIDPRMYLPFVSVNLEAASMTMVDREGKPLHVYSGTAAVDRPINIALDPDSGHLIGLSFDRGCVHYHSWGTAPPPC